jgi:hypothetical protein
MKAKSNQRARGTVLLSTGPLPGGFGFGNAVKSSVDFDKAKMLRVVREQFGFGQVLRIPKLNEVRLLPTCGADKNLRRHNEASSVRAVARPHLKTSDNFNPARTNSARCLPHSFW